MPWSPVSGAASRESDAPFSPRPICGRSPPDGISCLTKENSYYGSVGLSDAMFDQRLPDVPPFFSRHYTAAHRFGLVSLAEACADADLDFRSGELSDAAILVGRGGIDANIDSYLAVLQADPNTIPATEAMELFVAAEQAVTPSDVALVQGALTRSKGPNFTVSCGCASSAVQIGNARRLITSGEVDIAVVTGVDVFSITLIDNIQRLLKGAQKTYEAMRSDDMPALLPSFDSLMRPYDRRADCINHGEGSVTIIMESRDHASRRGAHQYGRGARTGHHPRRAGQPAGQRRDGQRAGNCGPPVSRRPRGNRRGLLRPRRQRRQRGGHRFRGQRHQGTVRIGRAGSAR